MDKYYLEFLDELVYSLRKYDDSKWSDWMYKSSLAFRQRAELNYFFSAFGGAGSFNDNYFSGITTELANITYKIASSLRDNRQDDIMSIIEVEQKRCINVCNMKYSTDYDNECLNYINYLINNYNLGNLHDITEEYRNNKCIKSMKQRVIRH